MTTTPCRLSAPAGHSVISSSRPPATKPHKAAATNLIWLGCVAPASGRELRATASAPLRRCHVQGFGIEARPLRSKGERRRAASSREQVSCGLRVAVPDQACVVRRAGVRREEEGATGGSPPPAASAGRSITRGSGRLPPAQPRPSSADPPILRYSTPAAAAALDLLLVLAPPPTLTLLSPDLEPAYLLVDERYRGEILGH
nr:unnamed protein product [Digitaria exilis]